MSQRGRPRNTTPSIHFAIAGWLHPEHDADILAWLNAIPKGERMNALKTALRSGGLKPGTDSNNGEPDQAQSAADEILGHWEY
jgi:hypothetical protein